MSNIYTSRTLIRGKFDATSGFDNMKYAICYCSAAQICNFLFNNFHRVHFQQHCSGSLFSSSPFKGSRFSNSGRCPSRGVTLAHAIKMLTKQRSIEVIQVCKLAQKGDPWMKRDQNAEPFRPTNSIFRISHSWIQLTGSNAPWTQH
jgi:hypothetical protein